MQELLTGQRRLTGFSDEWKVKRLGEVSVSGSGGTPPTTVDAFYHGDIPWVSIADMTTKGKRIAKTERNLSRRGLAESTAQMFPAGTVLYAMYASIGECSIAEVPLSSSQAILGIRCLESLHNDFLYYSLTYLKHIVRAMGQHGTQTNLNAAIVRGFKLRMPSFAEQFAIAKILLNMDEEIAGLEVKISKTRRVKRE